MPMPASRASSRPERRSGRVADARDEHHGHDRQPDPDQHERRRHALQDDAGGDRDHGRDHARHGRDDPHPADGQSLVEGTDPDPAGDPGKDAPADVGGRRRGLAAYDRQDQREDEPDELRDQDDPEQRRSPGQQPATEIAATPRHGGEEAEENGGRRGPADLVQPRRPMGAAPRPVSSRSGDAVPFVGRPSAPVSSAVGPSSTTTASASSS